MTNDQDKFVTLAIEHGQTLEQGDYRKANKIHKELTSIYNSIKQLNKWTGLMEVITHENDYVKIWAATFLLTNNEDMALTVLRNVAQSDSIAALEASMTIDLWNKGLLNLL